MGPLKCVCVCVRTFHQTVTFFEFVFYSRSSGSVFFVLSGQHFSMVIVGLGLDVLSRHCV